MRSLCKCGYLKTTAEDDISPIFRDASSGAYCISLSHSRVIEIHFCPHCGGHDNVKEEDGPWHCFRGGDPCTCGLIQAAVSETETHVSFDIEMNEFACRGFIFYYCPSCGGRMPKSRRGELFTDVSPDESQEFFLEVMGLKSLAQVIKKLGPPDRTYFSVSVPKAIRDAYEIKNITRAIEYYSRWKTITGMITEFDDGSIQVSCGGKPRAQNSN